MSGGEEQGATTRKMKSMPMRYDQMMDAPVGDSWLVGRFAQSRDSEAFAELVRRHGPMVLGVCRRILRNEHDAEDAFQAAFLVLARRAGAIQYGRSLGNWLFGVARNVSIHLRDKNSRRLRHESLAIAQRPTTTSEGGTDLSDWIDRELHQLPERYRIPLIACELEQHPLQGVADELGLSLSTLRRRLERGRKLLRARLLGRGVGASLCSVTLASAISPTLACEVCNSAVRFVNGEFASASTAILANGVLKMMTRAKMMTIFGFGLVMIATVAGSGIVWRSASTAAEQPGTGGNGTATQKKPATQPETPAPKAPVKILDNVHRDNEIKPGDRLTIRATGLVPDYPINGNYLVEPEGNVVIGTAYGGRVAIAGMTPIEATRYLSEYLKRFAKNPAAIVARYDSLADGDGNGKLLEIRVLKLELEVKELREKLAEVQKKLP